LANQLVGVGALEAQFEVALFAARVLATNTKTKIKGSAWLVLTEQLVRLEELTRLA
jgi:hypothetical protein